MTIEEVSEVISLFINIIVFLLYLVFLLSKSISYHYFHDYGYYNNYNCYSCCCLDHFNYSVLVRPLLHFFTFIPEINSMSFHFHVEGHLMPEIIFHVTAEMKSLH